MPKLGESVTEGTINTWLIKEGDKVNKYDPIAEVMTDKVNAEVPSSHTGVIKEIIVSEGDTVEVGELICYIETANGVKNTVDNTDEATKDAEIPPETANDSAKLENKQSMRSRFSPAVLKLSQEHNIDLDTIEGTGQDGRITRKDIRKAIEGGPKETKQPEMIQDKNTDQPSPLAAGDKEISLTGVRKVIADNMSRSMQEIPHAWMTVEADVTDLVNYRNKLKGDFKEREGINLTFFSFFVHAVAQALREFPQFNSVWNGNKLIQRKDINISIAVAKEEELFVPVIKQADNLSITGIAKEINRLAASGRGGKLTQDDMAGGTFTLNNTGSFGSVSSMGIINHPQVAILQVESIVKRPVIINDMFAARDIVNLSLSLDHRVLDGLICGRFLNRIKTILEGINEESFHV